MTSAIETIQVLVVDDEPSIRRLIEKELGSDRRRITAVGAVAEARRAFTQEAFDIVLLDMQLPDGNGMDLLTYFQELAPEVQVIIITGFGEVDDAVQAMKLGAYDYITQTVCPGSVDPGDGKSLPADLSATGESPFCDRPSPIGRRRNW